MRITEISVKNFRLLENVNLILEDSVTLIVGRNNSGKTSLTQLFRRLLDDKSPSFRIEDFSTGILKDFWVAFQSYQNHPEDEQTIRDQVPQIKVTITCNYNKDEDLGPLAPFVVDLDEDCTRTRINIIYSLKEGKIEPFFAELGDDRTAFFKVMKERIPRNYSIRVIASDPNDDSNQKPLEWSNLNALIQHGFINAQRALDDASNRERAVLGKVFEKLFTAAASDAAVGNDKTTASALATAVEDIQKKIDTDFNERLVKQLIPTFEIFGYPGLTDPDLRTETILKVEQLLRDHTTVGYLAAEGVNLPESYNGLGPRNLIFILLKLYEFFKDYCARPTAPGVQLVFIEEPEAHLHPQMQTVFIRKLTEIRHLFETTYNSGNSWPVQFVVTTHSSHIANEASFDSMRYFLTSKREQGSRFLRTEVKDLRIGLSKEEEVNRSFLHKYMTLTRCDLLFADGAIIIEGTSERLLIPEMVHKFDSTRTTTEVKLGNKFLTIMEVGGAYAHIFLNLLAFLQLRALIITDLDSVDSSGKKCVVSSGVRSSNACLNQWFVTANGVKPTIGELLSKTDKDKVSQNIRVAYQVPHEPDAGCGRTLEDAFMLANGQKFGIVGTTAAEKEQSAMANADKQDKTSFALEYAVTDTSWNTPRYIEDGLLWLSQVDDHAGVSEQPEEQIGDKKKTHAAD